MYDGVEREHDDTLDLLDDVFLGGAVEDQLALAC